MRPNERHIDGIRGDAELLASYLDGGLGEEERSRFEAHLAKCEICLAELVAAKAEIDEGLREGWFPRARASRPGLTSRIARLMSLLAPAPANGAAALAAGTSLCAAVLMAAGLLALMRSPGWDPDFLAGRSGAARVLEAADMGALRLAGSGAAPRDTVSATRGSPEFDRDLLERSIVSLERSRERHAGDWRSYSLLGGLQLAAGRIEEADRLYARALDLRPGDAALLNDRGVAAYRAADLEGARGYLERAFAADPRAPEVVYNLAVLHRDIGDREQAARFLRLYLEIDGGSPWSERLRAPSGP